jgi:hypothetical protein
MSWKRTPFSNRGFMGQNLRDVGHLSPGLKCSLPLKGDLSMKEGSLFCNYEIQDASDRVLGVLSWCVWKVLDEVGCMGLVPWHLDLWCKSSLKIKLNCRWIFWRNWNVPLMLLERSWWAGFNQIYLVRLGFTMWEILIFKWFLPPKIQINSKKPGFIRKNQLRIW